MSSRMTKPTKWLRRRRKTQISLGICPVWSVFAVRLKNLALLATHWAHSLRWAHRSFCWSHVKLWSNSTNGTKYKRTNIWMDERKDENYIPLGINAGGLMKKSTSYTRNLCEQAWQNQQNDLCAERRHRLALAFAQSNQSSLSAWRTLYF